MKIALKYYIYKETVGLLKTLVSKLVKSIAILKFYGTYYQDNHPS